MLKNILKLEGVQKLSATQQKVVKGGQPYCIDPRTGECRSTAPICRKVCGNLD
jgi:hypothetical protein